MPAWFEEAEPFAAFETNKGQWPTWIRLDKWASAVAGVRDWPHLNKVTLQETDLAFWKPHVHTLFAWIDAKNKTGGAGAWARKKAIRRAKKRKLAKAQRRPSE